MFMVPGWNQTLDYPNITQPLDPVFPTYSRVAHGKFLLTENRVNVGTSNYQWGYFYQTAGTSLNTDDVAIREGVESAFDRDWDSSYAVVLEDFSDPRTWNNEPW
jgi:phospholipase D3/4